MRYELFCSGISFFSIDFQYFATLKVAKKKKK